MGIWARSNQDLTTIMWYHKYINQYYCTPEQGSASVVLYLDTRYLRYPGPLPGISNLPKPTLLGSVRHLYPPVPEFFSSISLALIES